MVARCDAGALCRRADGAGDGAGDVWGRESGPRARSSDLGPHDYAPAGGHRSDTYSDTYGDSYGDGYDGYSDAHGGSYAAGRGGGGYGGYDGGPAAMGNVYAEFVSLRNKQP